MHINHYLICVISRKNRKNEIILFSQEGIQMENILNTYYADNAKKLRKAVDKILLKFGGISDKDDFYSLANEVFADVMKKYDASQSFDICLYSCLSNKIKTEMTRRNREKRKADIMSVSIDTPVGDNEDYVLGDIIAGDFNIEKEIFGEETLKSLKLEKYLNKLSKCQRKILELSAASYDAGEIQKMLNITQKEYTDNMMAVHSYENIKILL